MGLSNILFYAFALFVFFKVHWAIADHLLEKKVGAALLRRKKAWSEIFGIKRLYEYKRLSWTFDNYAFFRKTFEDRGTTTSSEILWKHSILTCDSENIKAILSTQFDDFGKGTQFRAAFRDFLGEGIFAADGERWKHSRAMLRPQFQKSRIADLEIINSHAEIMISQIESGMTTDFNELVFKMTLDAATDYLFGESTNTLINEDGDSGFAQTFSKVQEIQARRALSGPLWALVSSGPHVKDLNKFLNQYVQKVLDQPIDKKIDFEKASFLEVLAQDTRDPIELRDQLVSVIFASRDSIASELVWTLKHLSNDPVRYERLRREVLAVIGSEGVATYQQLKDMSYLRACMDETLRLYPIIPFNIRTALCDTTLPRGGGNDGNAPVAVRKGMQVVFTPLVLHRTQNIPDVESWIPERWAKWTPKPWTYIPFNGGPRICPGQQFALMEMSVVLAQIAQRFVRLENADIIANDYAMRYNVSLTARHGSKVKFYTE